ncbi:unnamed protein product [Lota lota]
MRGPKRGPYNALPGFALTCALYIYTRYPAAIQPSRLVARPHSIPRLCLKCQASAVCREPALANHGHRAQMDPGWGLLPRKPPRGLDAERG